MPDPTIIVALIGGAVTLLGAWLGHRFGRRKNDAEVERTAAEAERTDAEADKVNAEAEQVAQQTLALVMETLRAEITRLSQRQAELATRVENLESELRTTQAERAAAEAELAQTRHRFEVLVDHHGHVVRVATDAGVALPPPPAALVAYLQLQ